MRFDGPDGTVEAVLHDWGGKRPEDPPTLTLPMLVTVVLTPLLLSAAILIIVRRRRLLKAGERLNPTV
ncbi:hypothetical protein ACFY4H_22705 [Streptomyces althioticus]|uniref:hypothetical protein n=1 Tax=Streptomyces althioticus TaxID=83380 RepID=UPI0036D0992F